jgi:hypothetical protein
MLMVLLLGAPVGMNEVTGTDAVLNRLGANEYNDDKDGNKVMW